MTRARVKRELIRWAREDAGLTIADVARKTGTSVDRVSRWEEGTLAPTLRQLRLLGNAAKRPLAVFYLAEPPKRFQAMHDFRRLPGDPLAEGSPEFRLALRSAMARREVALQLAEGLDAASPELGMRVALDEQQRDVAARVRLLLSIPLERQRGWSGAYEALNGWRAAIEAQGVLVFQASGVDLREMRGFSIAEDPLPAIVLNVRDTPNGRVFTLLHEFCHLLLRRGGVCDLAEQGARAPEDDRVEVFCNAVAAELLDAGRTTRGFAPPDIAAVSQAGVPFIQLVLDSYYQERITSRDLSEYLGINLKHLATIEERVMGRHVMFA
ncbi:MAG TPA: helix-turn-helix domain-containing protein [Longimicrobiales bacterium]|nr:helix-turn-helix domain-containing protein [Longimicrobiales bacterium]